MTHSPKTAEDVLKDISDGMSVPDAAKNNGVSPGLIYQWANGSRTAPIDGFADHYARAMSVRADMMAQEILDISDDDSLDIGFDDEGKPFVKGENIQRSKLKVDTRKWLMAKMQPKKYGDKITNEHTGEGGGAIPLALSVRFVGGEDE